MVANEQQKDPNILMKLGLELYLSGKIDEALDNYGKAFDILSKMPSKSVAAETRETLLTQYSAFLFSKQKYNEITGVLTSKLANKYGGLNASQHYLLGFSYYKLKKINEAVVELKLCVNKLEQNSSHALKEIYQGEPHYLLAVCYAVLNKVKEAEREFTKAIKENPDSYKFNYDYARFLAGQGNFVKALELLNKIIPENPGNPAVWQVGARIALNNHNLTGYA
ncbi:MAG TPA: tetratricopeptide repeat protein, partial [Verrucomicrobiota bacterium]|nr:tetratricopeptide repeat protein [Verrucomicrobiota bacterium]